MAHKTLIGGTAYEISGGGALVDGTAYSIKNGKTLVDGTGYEIGFGTSIGDLAFGSSVYMNVDGVDTEFLVIHQGLPDGYSVKYSDSCNGTWLLMKDIYTTMSYARDNEKSENEYSRFYNYDASTFHTYLNNEFLGLLDDNIQSIIREAGIPCRTGNYDTETCSLIYAKIFLLSRRELCTVYSTDKYAAMEGGTLDYFDYGGETIAYFNGVAIPWWLRSPNVGSIGAYWLIDTDGDILSSNYAYIDSDINGVRPALILPPETLVDSNFNVIA